MGVAVHKDVDAGDGLEQVGGAAARRGGVDAQVSQAEDVGAAGLFQGVHLSLGAVKQGLFIQEGHALELVRVGLGGRLRRGQPEQTDPDAAVGGEDQLALQSGGAVGLEGIDGQDGEVGLLDQGLQVGIAVVELVVAGGGSVIAGQRHKLHGSGPLGEAHSGVALDEVAGIDQQHVGPGSLVGFL